MNRQELMNLPKIELHCHLDGSLPLTFVEERLGREVADSELRISDDCESLAEYLEKFTLPLSCLRDEEGLRKAAKAFILDLHKENVVYVEVRFAPLNHISDKLSVSGVIEAVLQGLEEGKQLTGIEYGLILCCMRHHKQEDSLAMMREALPYRGRGVCSLDLAGGEASFPMAEFMDLFREACRMGWYPMTIHAGEQGNVQNILDSIEVGAVRVGHGIAMTGNDVVKKICKDKGIALEMCPISNIQTKAIPSPEKYPLREFLEYGLKVTINTDNRTVSGTSLTREYQWIQENCGIHDDELLQIIRNALEVSFASEEVKEKIRKKLR